MAFAEHLHSTCPMCGVEYKLNSGSPFYVNYGTLNKGVGHLFICKKCVNSLYEDYLRVSGEARYAVRQTCRKLDIFYSHDILNKVLKSSSVKNVIGRYIAAVRQDSSNGKTYDDTLIADGTMWEWVKNQRIEQKIQENEDDTWKGDYHDESFREYGVTKDIVEFWGNGYSPSMYHDLEQRRGYWMKKLPDGVGEDPGAEAIIRQICSLELDINRDRVAGKPVESKINALNNLLGSASLQPSQKKKDISGSESDNTLGVLIEKLEKTRPIPDVDPELKDVDGLIKYIDIWFRGHGAKAAEIRNSYSALYEQEIERLREEYPQLSVDDDEMIISNAFGDSEQDSITLEEGCDE